MPILGVSTDYSNRTKDISIFQGVDPAKTKNVDISFGTISNYCTGIQKLIQRFAICLLTELGSQFSYTGFGSTLQIYLKRSNQLLNKADIYPIFNISANKIIDEFRQYQVHSNAPDDEKLNTVFLEDVLVAGTSVSLRIRIVPMSLSDTIFIIPLPN